MIRRLALAASLVVASLPGVAAAQLSGGTIGGSTQLPGGLGGLILPTWKCRRGDGTACTDADYNDQGKRQILLVPAGFQSIDKAGFWADFDTMVTTMGQAGNSWTARKRAQLLYVGYFLGGGPLGAADAVFGAKVFAHPVRGKALTLNQDAVYAKVDELRATLSWLRPMTVGVLFNSFETGVTANASPPSFLGKSFGVARWTRQDLIDRAGYIGSHELGHAGLNFLDEYVEEGFENMSITSFDALTPLAIWDGGLASLDNAVGDLLGVYDINISEILASNGNSNIALGQYPGTVSSAAGSGYFAYEHGMFFGRGTWHAAGKNLMNSDRLSRAADDGFAFDHSADQARVIEAAFGAPAPRANDRLRNAGPVSGWPLEFGSSTTVMMFDADKNHHFHKTQQYTVQVGWYERVWKTCWAAFVPYPCYDNVWRTAQKTVSPTRESLQLKTSSLFGLASLTQGVVCGLGLGGLAGGLDLCTLTVDQMSDAFLPSLVFYLPYQYTTVPASQWMTTYYWRFRTSNGRFASGYTGWSSFYRSL